MNRPNFNHLFNFYTIANEGSIKSAGITLGISSPTLSEQLQELEADLGCALFSRTGRELKLNSQGRFLYESVSPLFGVASDAIAALQSREIQNHPVVEIGITTEVSKLFAFELLGPVFRRNGILVRIIEGESNNLLMDFKLNKLDIYITYEVLSKNLIRNVSRICVHQPNLIAVGTKDFSSLKEGFPRSLDKAPMFLFTVRSPLRWELEKFLKKNRIAPYIKSEVDDIDIIKMAVMQGLGVSILPEDSVKRELAAKKLVKIGDVDGLKTNVYAYHVSNDLEEHVQKVVDSFPSSE